MADQIASAIDRRYDTLRKRASQQQRGAQQETQDAIKRQFARMGNVNSGSYIKQTQLARDKGQQALQQANEGIEMARGQEHQQNMQQQANRDFARSEREAGQVFQAEQADIARKFATSERLAGQKFATGERIAGQDFQTLMYDRNFRDVVKPQMELAMKQFGLEERAQDVNERLQIATAISQGLPGYELEDLRRWIGDKGMQKYTDAGTAEGNVAKDTHRKLGNFYNNMTNPFRYGNLFGYKPNYGFGAGSVSGWASDRMKNIFSPSSWSW